MVQIRPVLCLVLIVSGLLVACGGRVVVPVSDHSTDLRYPESEYRVVRTGDTLYSIAWETGRDYQELAVWNHISSPYTIRPGQKLRLFPPADAPRIARGSKNYRVVGKGDTLYRIARETGVNYRDLAAWNAIPPPYTVHVGQKLIVSEPDNVAGRSPASGKKGHRSRQKQAPVSRSVPRTRSSQPTAFGPWSWPTQGRLTGRFNVNGSKGVEIEGRKGQAVYAAAPGTVVYQGSGLRGYGQLIIIKHNADFLSAYAHNNRIVVQEGNVIKRGQKIAEMGSSGSNRVKLHFEIRHRGVPVDPLKYLPRQ